MKRDTNFLLKTQLQNPLKNQEFGILSLKFVHEKLKFNRLQVIEDHEENGNLGQMVVILFLRSHTRVNYSCRVILKYRDNHF